MDVRIISRHVFPSEIQPDDGVGGYMMMYPDRDIVTPKTSSYWSAETGRDIVTPKMQFYWVVSSLGTGTLQDAWAKLPSLSTPDFAPSIND